MLNLIGFILWSIFVFFAGMFATHALLEFNRSRKEEKRFPRIRRF
jgi:membrane protein DedA with SNARE-associated domain